MAASDPSELLALLDATQPYGLMRYPTLEDYSVALAATARQETAPMATEVKAWAVGDPCPACQGDLKPIPTPTDAQRAAAAHRDNPVPLPPTVDTADAAQVAELGELHRCGKCGYQTRVAPAAAASGSKRGKGKSASADSGD